MHLMRTVGLPEGRPKGWEENESELGEYRFTRFLRKVDEGGRWADLDVLPTAGKLWGTGEGASNNGWETLVLNRVKETSNGGEYRTRKIKWGFMRIKPRKPKMGDSQLQNVGPFGSQNSVSRRC